MMMNKSYSYNYNILCAACNKPRYMKYTDLPDSQMCCCAGQDKIPTYDRRHELSDEALLYASEEDWAFYKKIGDQLPSMAGKNNDGLDKFGVPIPYHSGPHILRHFRETLEIVKPNKIVELGFNMGHSAAMWLELSNAYLHSFDISEKDETKNAADYLMKKYHPRFTFWKCDTKELLLTDPDIDLIFIDAAHDEASIVNDIRVAKMANIPYILMDDWYPRYADTQLAVAKYPDLELVKDMNNLRLYKWKS